MTQEKKYVAAAQPGWDGREWLNLWEVEELCRQARKANMPTIVLSPDRKDAVDMAGLGASAFMVSSDHGFLKSAASQALKTFAPPIS